MKRMCLRLKRVAMVRLHMINIIVTVDFFLSVRNLSLSLALFRHRDQFCIVFILHALFLMLLLMLLNIFFLSLLYAPVVFSLFLSRIQTHCA